MHTEKDSINIFSKLWYSENLFNIILLFFMVYNGLEICSPVSVSGINPVWFLIISFRVTSQDDSKLALCCDELIGSLHWIRYFQYFDTVFWIEYHTISRITIIIFGQEPSIYQISIWFVYRIFEKLLFIFSSQHFFCQFVSDPNLCFSFSHQSFKLVLIHCCQFGLFACAIKHFSQYCHVIVRFFLPHYFIFWILFIIPLCYSESSL